MTANAVPKAMALTSRMPPELTPLYVMSSDPSDEARGGSLSEKQTFADDVAALMSFRNIKDERTVTATDGTVLRGTRIAVPHPLYTSEP